MSLLIAGLAIVAGATLLNLLLVAGLIARLREIYASVEEWRVRASGLGVGGLRATDPVPEFVASTVRQDSITNRDLIGDTWIIGFFAGGCGTCHVDLPRLANMMRHEEPRRKALVVIGGTQDDSGDLIEAGQTFGATVLEPPDGELSRAFRVPFFPTFFVTDERGRVAFGTSSLDDLLRQLALST